VFVTVRPSSVYFFPFKEEFIDDFPLDIVNFLSEERL